MARTVLITGSNRGIGLGLTGYFLKKGDTVIATARDPQRADKLETWRKQFPQTLKVVTLDVSDTTSIENLPAALKGISQIDILINNAGVYLDDDQSFEELSFEMVERTWETNTLGPMRITRALLPLLKKATAPKVVGITSQMGSIADNHSGGYYAYRISKAALNMFHKSLALDFPAFQCVVLHPGWVQTDMGGAHAAVTVEDSVAGLARVIEGLQPSDTGRFLNFRGNEVPW